MLPFQNIDISAEEHLKTVDILELTNRIKRFRSLNFREINDKDLFEEIINVLTWNGSFQYITNCRTISQGTKLFRVRKLSGSIIPIQNFKRIGDLWEPPADKLFKPGRLNKPHEPLLYVADNPITAVKETDIKSDEFYAIIQYEAQAEIKINIIGGDYDYSSLGFTDKHAILVHEMYNNFLRDEFSRDVGDGTEFLYRISESIAKSYFDLPPQVQDAWAYTSLQDKKAYNLCFRPDVAHNILRVHGAMICKKDDTDNIRVVATATLNSNNEVVYYPLGSPQQKSLFPEIV